MKVNVSGELELFGNSVAPWSVECLVIDCTLAEKGMSSISAIPLALQLKGLDAETRKTEQRLPPWRKYFRWFFTGKAYIANNIGEAKGWILATLAFWSVPAKVMAASVWDHGVSFVQGVGVLLRITSDVS